MSVDGVARVRDDGSMRLALWAVIVGVSGCSGTPENFWRGMTRAACKYNRDCTRVEVPSSLGDCAEEMQAEVMEPDEFAARCVEFDHRFGREYDPEIGRACIGVLRQAREACTVPEESPVECENICGLGSSVNIEFRQAEGGQLATPVPSFTEPGI